jgi:very-short-patch-repair endonuclease
MTSGSWSVMEPAELCLDLGRSVTPWALARIICDLRYHGFVDIKRLAGFIATRARHPGAGVVRQALVLIAGNSAGTRGKTEEELLRITREAGLEIPLVNVRGAVDVPNEEPDFVYRRYRLNVECDGGHHLEPAQAAQDALRDEQLAGLRWRVLRIWWRDVWRRPDAVVALIKASMADQRHAADFVRERWKTGRYRLTL